MSKISSTRGFLPVMAALSGNTLVALAKFAGFLLSGSSSLFSESVHSLADTLNQLLLLVGLKRSVKQADHGFSYGYGQERFIWALISACGIFFLGAGVTIYRGIDSLLKPESVHIGSFVYAILFISFVTESFTLIFAARDIRKNYPELSFFEILNDGDPITLAVLYEDGVAVLGVIIAFISILLTNVTGYFYWDAFGSILIGLMLGLVAIVLINKNRQYLIKKSIPAELQEEIIELLLAEPAIEKVHDFKSSVINVGEFQIKCDVELNGTALLKESYKNNQLREAYDEVKDDYDEFIRFTADFADRIPRLVGTLTDNIEQKIQKKHPQIKFIDIEIN